MAWKNGPMRRIAASRCSPIMVRDTTRRFSWPSRRRTVLGCDRTAPSTGRRRPAPDRTPTRTAAADRIVGSGRPREGNRRGRTPLRAPDPPVGPAAVRSRAAGPTLLDGHDGSLRTHYASGAACGGPHDNRLVSREGSRLPDAAIRLRVRKADEEAIPSLWTTRTTQRAGGWAPRMVRHTSLAGHLRRCECRGKPSAAGSRPRSPRPG